MAAVPAGNGMVAADAAESAKLPLPPAVSIFKVLVSEPGRSGSGPRTGELLDLPTPTFVLLTSRGMPLYLRPEVLDGELGKYLVELPIGDLIVRQDLVKNSPQAAAGCCSIWGHLKDRPTYCSFRNPRLNQSVHGGDSVCSVETVGGRRKVGVKELLEVQRVMRANIVAAPGEEVAMDVASSRRSHRAVGRAGDWLKEILEAKAQDTQLASFDWHVLASVQGGNDLKIRAKACETAALQPVAGFWIGGLGYSESLGIRSPVLEAVCSALPPALPRFLPLNSGTPVEVLQAVLFGVDVFEVSFPVNVSTEGIALTFDWEMPGSEVAADEAADEEALLALLPPANGQTVTAPPLIVRQMHLRSPECREDFRPINEASPVHQYSRAYLYHLHQVRELLGTMLLVQHNLHVYSRLFAAIRGHIAQGTLRRFAAWFLRTQTVESLEPPPAAATAKRRKT